jgi:hypothetical protein
MKQTIQQEWDRLSKAMVRQTCHAFRQRLEKFVTVYGGYINEISRTHLYLSLKTSIQA